MTSSRDDIIKLAEESGCSAGVRASLVMSHPETEWLEALFHAAQKLEREECATRRGVLLFNPYSGKPRHPLDVQSDPHGILMLDPEAPLRAATKEQP